MTYGLSNGHVIDDVTWPTKVLWGSTVGYPSDSLASCLSLSLRDIEGYEQDTTLYVPIRNNVRVRYVYGKFLPYTYRVDFVELATFIVRNRLTDRDTSFHRTYF